MKSSIRRRYFPDNPLIIIGCHRSGTSFLASCLEKHGVYIGGDLRKHHESDLFFQINKSIFCDASTTWDSVGRVASNLDDHSCRIRQSEIVRARLDTLRSAYGYWRRHLFLPWGRFGDSTNWGWKDPRNTGTLPVWLDVFPNAKVVHIYRNGLDVANSLSTRERRRSAHSIWGSERCKSFDGAFDVWEEYEETALQLTERYIDPKNLYRVKYEYLLESTTEVLSDILGFIGCQPDQTVFGKIEVDLSRKNAYENNVVISKMLAEKIQQSKIMRTYGYS